MTKGMVEGNKGHAERLSEVRRRLLRSTLRRAEAHSSVEAHGGAAETQAGARGNLGLGSRQQLGSQVLSHPAAHRA